MRPNQIDSQANVVDRALAVGSSGALRLYRTTPLLSVEQGMTSMKRAGEIRQKYSPPVTVSLEQKVPAAR